MKPIRSMTMSAAAALVLATAMIGSAGAQNQSAQKGAGSSGSGGGYGFMGMMGPGMMGYDRGGPWMMRGDSGQAMCGAMAGHIEGRLAFVKTELKITPAQEALWNTYAAAARDSANTMLTRCTTMMGQRGASKVSLPDRLDQNEQLMAAQLDAVRATNKALKPLYADFSDSQKQSADQLFWGPMGMMGMM
jgi:LTXXQ motif family protein